MSKTVAAFFVSFRPKDTVCVMRKFLSTGFDTCHVYALRKS